MTDPKRHTEKNSPTSTGSFDEFRKGKQLQLKEYHFTTEVQAKLSCASQLWERQASGAQLYEWLDEFGPCFQELRKAALNAANANDTEDRKYRKEFSKLLQLYFPKIAPQDVTKTLWLIETPNAREILDQLMAERDPSQRAWTKPVTAYQLVHKRLNPDTAKKRRSESYREIVVKLEAENDKLKKQLGDPAEVVKSMAQEPDVLVDIIMSLEREATDLIVQALEERRAHRNHDNGHTAP